MDLQDVFNRLNFWVNKYQNSYFTIQELTDLVDSGQLSYYRDLKPKYATSQLVKDILSPFRARYNFTPSNTISGVISVPSDSDYLDLLDIQIQYQISNRTVYAPVKMINEDERAIRLNSQLSPVTVTSPIGEQLAPRFFMLYPTAGYTGIVTYFKRPQKPFFAYTTVSERVIVYDPINSIQLEWRDTDIVPLLLKSLQSIGINLSDSEVAQFASVETNNNWMGQNRL